jgi:uncharacterized damage-inducible protein DinB
MSCPICHKEHPYSTEQALAGLAATPKRLARLAEKLGPRGSAARPVPDKWSAREIISHLADCEVVYGFRYRKILAEPGTELVAFDQDRWAEGLRYREQPLAPTLTSFSALRSQHLSLFRSLSGDAWDRTGRHPEYGPLSLRQLVLHLVEHDRNHTAQVERLAEALKGAGATKKKAKPAPRKGGKPRGARARR